MCGADAKWILYQIPAWKSPVSTSFCLHASLIAVNITLAASVVKQPGLPQKMGIGKQSLLLELSHAYIIHDCVEISPPVSEFYIPLFYKGHVRYQINHLLHSFILQFIIALKHHRINNCSTNVANIWDERSASWVKLLTDIQHCKKTWDDKKQWWFHKLLSGTNSTAWKNIWIYSLTKLTMRWTHQIQMHRLLDQVVDQAQ